MSTMEVDPKPNPDIQLKDIENLLENSIVGQPDVEKVTEEHIPVPTRQLQMSIMEVDPKPNPDIQLKDIEYLLENSIVGQPDVEKVTEEHIPVPTRQLQMSIVEVDPKPNPDIQLDDIEYLLENSIVGQPDVEKVTEERKMFLQKTDISREDCFEQITAEIQLLETCKSHINYHVTVDETQSAVHVKVFDMLINRIDYLFFSMLQMFPIILSALEEYMDFRLIHQVYIHDTSLLHKLMATEHNDPEVYKSAAMFEYGKMCNVENARLCFSEGLKYHKHCKILHTEEFDIEVQHVEHTNGESQPIALSKYENVVQCFKGDLEFHFILVEKVLQFHTVRELQFRVLWDMYMGYKHDERMWQKLAEINFNGFIFDYDLKLMNFDRHCKRRLVHSLKAFDDGLKEDWTPIKRKTLWNLFIDHVISIWKEYSSKNETIVSFVNETMERVFQGAQNEGFLYKAEHYAYWAEYKNEERHDISLKAIEMNKNNPNVWIELISIYAKTEAFEMAFKVFQDGIKSLKSDSMLLWELMESFLIYNNENLLFDFYHQATYESCNKISLIFRVRYLRWFKKANGLSGVRRLFKELVKVGPPCKQLFIEMISYEQSTNNANLEQVSKLYNDVCCSMGLGDVELWTNYIRFEYTYVEKYRAKQIYKSALPILGPELFDVLTLEFEKIKDEFRDNNLTIHPEIIDVDSE